jgi:hypothetical protein
MGGGMRSLRLLSAGAVGLVLGASGARGGTPPQTVAVTLGPAAAQIVLIEGRDAARLLGEWRAPPADANDASERQLLAYCSAGEPQRIASDKGLVFDILSTLVTVVLDKAAEKVRAELAKYSAVSERTRRIDYYRGGPAGVGSGRLESRYTCLRYTRLASDAGNGAEVALDFVAGIGLDSDRDAILLQPLRLYVSKALARSVTGRYGVAISVRAEAVWRDAMVGHQGVVFDQTVTSESMDLSSRPFLSYYPADPLLGRRVPVIPVSADSDRSRDFGRVDLTVTAAETGVQPAVLTVLAQYLPTTVDRRVRLLQEAAAIASQPLP